MSWWHYLLLVNFYLLLFFAFYALLLRRETFFQLNRIYLVAASILSFAIPVIQADWVKNLFITKQVQHTLYGGGAELMVYNFQQVKQSVTIGNILTGVYITVTLFLTLRLLWQLLVLKKQIEKPSPSAAYSFFKKISLGKDVEGHEAIASHEQAHVAQWHSVDVMIIETVMIINWFNPVVYLYRFAIKYIHEYIADRQVVSSGTNKADYALLLLSQTFHVPAHHLTNPFYSHSMLKKRIIMLQKSRSQHIMLFKYCLSVPLFVLMMVLSSATVNNSATISNIHDSVKDVLQAPIETFASEITDHAEIPPPLPTVDEVKFPPLVVAGLRYDSVYLNPSSPSTPAQNADELMPSTKIYASVEKQPEFPGGLAAFGKFLEKNVLYPAQSRENNVQGNVFVSFVVETDGSLTDILAVKGPSQELKAEAVRVISNSPNWNPGRQEGKAVRVQYTVPIRFVLGDGDGDQSNALPDRNQKTLLTNVEMSPEFPGGMAAFSNFLSRNLRFPQEMRARGLQGKVFVTFVVGEDGELSDIRAVRGPSDEFKEEAVRILARSPRWRPGVQNGKRVKVQYTVPIDFRLAFDEPQGQPQNVDFNDEAPAALQAPKQIINLKPADYLRARSANTNADPLIILDGVASDKSLREIKSSDIRSVSVIKPPQSVNTYGEKGKNGALVIQTKNDDKR